MAASAPDPELYLNDRSWAKSEARADPDLSHVSDSVLPREPRPVKGGTTIIAFVQRPDGYKIELLERT